MKVACTILALLAASGIAACSAPPPSHPAGELYLDKPETPRPVPSTDNDPNGGAN